MKAFTDLHIHSKYSRATSKNLDISNIAKFGKIKGLNLIGTGDFCHPIWLNDLKRKLKDSGTGIYSFEGMNFALSVELSLIYSQDGKGRRIHNIILAPNFEIVDQINEFLDKKGRRDYDGRPIFGFNSIELVENLVGISKDIEIIPAHIWTPWFSLYGSNSGFDTIKDCFGDQTKHIHAVETGLSSDPEMNWRVSELDNLSILSFSDSHSYWPWRLGRECCLFDMKELTYKSLIDCIRQKEKEKLLMTLEFFPEEGKYHYDGHRNCNIVMNPTDAERCKNICPSCKKPLTLGVLHRVEQLAEREAGYRPKHSADFKRLVPLSELISAVIGSPLMSKKTWEIYNLLIDRFGNEFNVLLDVEEKELAKVANEKVVNIIMKNRNGTLKITPGYDGVYGKIIIEDHERQRSLKSFAKK